MKRVPATLDAVIFDFDGTLATLSIDFEKMRRVVMEHLSEYAIQTDNLENLYVLEMISAGRILVANHHPGKDSQYHQEAMNLIQEIEVNAAQEGHLIDGTKNMLAELRQMNIKSGVISRNCRPAIEQAFPDIYSAVDIVLTRDHISQVKPDPEHLRQALYLLQASPDKSAMVGDHPMDIKLGLDVGTMPIGVLTGHSDRSKLIAAGAELVLDKAADIIAMMH